MDQSQGARQRAVVLGASMAGLFAARVLSEHFDRVTVVERDRLPGSAAHRRGVPQGRHVHALLPGGGRILDRLFPGLSEELRDAGAPVLDDLAGLHFRPLGNLLSQGPSPLEPVLQASRPFLEAAVRNRVRQLPNVQVLDGRDVAGLIATPARDRVTGVRVVPRDGEERVQEVLCADLVVDAMGRAGRTPGWLKQLGYEPAREERVRVDVRYVSRPVRLPAGAVPEQLVLVGPEPGRLTGMALFAYEDDTWIFTVVGYGGRHPDPEPEAMLAAARDLAPAHVVAALAAARPLGDVSVHSYPASVRRRYDRLDRFPEGLLVVGDAICSFNPIYGQGMTVAAEEALALREVLRAGDTALARRFFEAAARPVDVAWQLSVGSDLALPEVPGHRSRGVRATNAYVGRVLAAARHDPVVASQFLRVIGFLDPPAALFRPGILGRVLLRSRRPGPAAVEAAGQAGPTVAPAAVE